MVTTVKVWVVGLGCYSDWGIGGIFATQEAAQRAAAEWRAKGARDVDDPVDYDLQDIPAAWPAVQS
jgi:hypothetical protein